MELTKFATNGKTLLAFLNTSDNLRIDVERTRNFDHALGVFRRKIDLKTVPHVEDFVHLAPVRTAFFGDGAEKRGHGEQIVLNYAAIVGNEVQNLRLCAAGAVHHAVNLGAQFV